MPNSNRQNQGSGIKTAATFGLGALVGAIAAGAMWYFSGEEEERTRAHQHQTQQQHYRPNHPVNQPPAAAANNTTEKDDEKDGTVKMCEVCFVSFVELKECGVEIVTTPCGHLYCRDCIVTSLTIKPECPHCRSHVRENELTRIYM